jgi:uncharacterized repeat protein (TIGR01451 family)
MIRLRSSHRRNPWLRAVRAGVGLALIAGLIGLPGGPAYAAAFVVGSNADGSDATPGDGLCATATGACTLRAAIEESNALAGADVITFAASVTRIRPGSALPAITDGVTIDGSVASPVPPNFPVPGVELDGSLAGMANGLRIQGSMTQIRGLAINRFTLDGVVVQADDVQVAGSFVGTDLAGMTALGNGGVGIHAIGATGVTVGGSNFLLDQTIVSGNARGIVIEGGGSSTITSALVGTDVTTEGDLGNLGDGVTVLDHQTTAINANQVSGNGGIGILIQNADHVTLNGNAVGIDLNGVGVALPNASGIELRGGTGVSEIVALVGNRIATNLGVGVRIGDTNPGPGVGVSGLTMTGNRIGTDGSGQANLGNGGDGIHFVDGENDGALIGGNAGQGNRIAFNGGAGIRVGAGNTNERIQANGIHSNGGLGILLDPGANGDQQPPLLTALVPSSDPTLPDPTIQGTLTGFLPNHPYRVEFFGNVDCATGAGEGREFLKQRTVTTDGQGSMAFSTTLTLGTRWRAVTATATDDVGTSQFSNCLQLGGGAASADLSIAKSITSQPPFVGGSDLAYRVTVRNDGPDAAAAVSVTDTLPAGTGYVGATASQGSCGHANGVVTCDLGGLPSGGQATVDLTVVLPDVADDTSLQNSASVASTTDDPDDADNTASVSADVVARRADLGLTKTDGLQRAPGGGPLTYTITATNHGPGDATGVTVSDTLPAGTTFGSATASQGSCAEAADAVTCQLGPLASGGSATVTLVVATDEVDDDTTVTNTATVDAAEPDPNAANDAATDATILEPAGGADLRVASLDDAPDPVTGGYLVGYTVVVRNEGAGDAHAVVLTDALPAGTRFVPPSPNPFGCKAANGVVACALGTVAAGGSATALLILETPGVAKSTSLSNVVTVTSPDDPNPANDTDTESTIVVPRQAGFAAGFVPPNAGRRFVADAITTWPSGWPIATSSDPTTAAVVTPGGGSGGVLSITESTCGGSFACRTAQRAANGSTPPPSVLGSVVTFSPPTVATAGAPYTGYLYLDRSIVPSTSGIRIAFRDGSTGTFVANLPWCGRSGPAPACVADIDRIYSWYDKIHLDLRVKVRFVRAGSFAVMR